MKFILQVTKHFYVVTVYTNIESYKKFVKNKVLPQSQVD
jgi:hypothetical protein